MKSYYKDTKYIIYDDGRCYSELSHKFLTPQMSVKYPTYNLTINGKKQKTKIHRMVAETFLPQIEGKMLVNHIDGDTHNFKLDNLEWVNAKENSLHAVKNGLLPVSMQAPIYLTPENEINGECWVNIIDWPLYLVSNYGRVINKRTKRLLKIHISNNGYPYVNLWKQGKGTTLQVHQIVFYSFYPEFDKQDKTYVVNHIDGNKRNNCLQNLERITRQENNLHAVYTIKTNNCAKPIYQLDENKNIINSFLSIAQATRETGINNIGRAIKKGSRAGGYYWQFQNNI